MAELIDNVLSAIGSDQLETTIADTKTRVLALTGAHPLPYGV